MRKRNFLMGLLAATTVPVFAQSTDAVSPTPNAIKPYLQVPSYKPDANVVRIFFSPTCPYSRQYLSFFKNLESSLNSKTAKESIFTPTTNLSDGIEYAMAFAAVRRFHSRYAQNFIDASMTAAQEKNINVFNFRGINMIASAVGFGRTKQLPESLTAQYRLRRISALVFRFIRMTYQCHEVMSITTSVSYLDWQISHER